MLLFSPHVAPNPIDVNSIEIGKLIHSNNVRITWMVCTHICDRLCENRPCSHLVVIRETLV